MSPLVVTWILTALGLLAVVLTRVRLNSEAGGGGLRTPNPRVLVAHTLCGLAAVVVWVVFLLLDPKLATARSVVGIVGIGLWWLTSLAGIQLMGRWRPSRGRRATPARRDRWGGMELSLLAHLGMCLGVAWFTWAYLTSLI